MTNEEIHNIYLHTTGKAEGLAEATGGADFPVMFAKAILEFDRMQRPWVGLTEEDWKQIWFEFDSLDTENDFQDYMAGKYGAGHYTDADMYWLFQKEIIEAIVNNKLKEKNG